MEKEDKLELKKIISEYNKINEKIIELDDKLSVIFKEKNLVLDSLNKIKEREREFLTFIEKKYGQTKITGRFILDSLMNDEK